MLRRHSKKMGIKYYVSTWEILSWEPIEDGFSEMPEPKQGSSRPIVVSPQTRLSPSVFHSGEAQCYRERNAFSQIEGSKDKKAETNSHCAELKSLKPYQIYVMLKGIFVSSTR